jgi:hypothetical protein
MGELLTRMSRRAWVGAAVALIVVVVGVVAVAALTRSGGKGSSTTPATAQDCGAVLNQLAISTDAATAAKAEQCFAVAFKSCKAATLTFTTSGVDAGATHTLSVTKHGGGCVVSDKVHSDVLTNSHDATATCTGAEQQSDGLHLSGCGDFGDFVVASRKQQQ